AEINQDPIVMEHFPALKTYDETEKFVHANMHLYKNNDLCLYAVEIKDTGEFIGFVGLLRVDFNLPFVPAVEILWRIGSKYWGQGYAYEAATALCDYAFNDKHLKVLVSFTVPANIRSVRLMERLGFVHEQVYDFDHPKIPSDSRLCRHVFYRLINKNV
ncbi:MAG: GNAT family N-acetyltransferase, partial [Leadbetterella sp.]|nr:GNAT family N-acetyltransferase [Leadbetterella sp.]